MNLFIVIYSLKYYQWLARTRFCVIIFCSLSFALLLVNIYFILFRDTDSAIYQTDALENSLLFVIKIDNNTSRHRHQSKTRIPRKSTFPLHSSLNRSEVIERVHGSMKNKLEMSDISMCEAVLAGSQWALWNLFDLVLSSLAPFALNFTFNMAIILRISRLQKMCSARPGPGDPINRNTATRKGEPQHVKRPLIDQRNQRNNVVPALINSRAERSVTVMLLATTFMFLAMRTPIAAGHSLQMLLSEEKLFELIDPVVCMSLFAVAEMLAFMQHATQFSVYLACSTQFRRALRKQLRLVFQCFGSFFLVSVRVVNSRQHNVDARNVIPLRPYRKQYHSCPLTSALSRQRQVITR